MIKIQSVIALPDNLTNLAFHLTASLTIPALFIQLLGKFPATLFVVSRTVYVTRHTFATWAIAYGASPE
ncbi:MAG: hypothetical protein V7K88_21290 [Nostoc sp.]|uniref:hypothetical protein n=1 Tax=Nostoc sp. TaxID=1180 RepID=UPI002FFAD0CA